MKNLNNKEQDAVEQLTKELNSPSQIHVYKGGQKTQEMLDILDIESPSVRERIKICNNPPTYAVPRRDLNTPEEVEAWVVEMRKKFKLN